MTLLDHKMTSPQFLSTPIRTDPMRQALFILQRRTYTTAQSRKPVTFRDLLKTPVLKTLFLTFLFGSAVVESSNARKEIESLKAAYDVKFRILRDVTQKIKNKEPVNVAQELNIANSMTRNKYNSVTDLEVDDQFEAFLNTLEGTDGTEDVEMKKKDDYSSVSEPKVASNSTVKDTKQFL